MSITATARSIVLTGDPSVLFFSTHQYPHYPGTGHATERGSGAAEGFTINVPMEAGEGRRGISGDVSQGAWCRLPTISSRTLCIISAGFDAHRDDPLASMGLTEEGYADLTASSPELPSSIAKDACCLRSRGL